MRFFWAALFAAMPSTNVSVRRHFGILLFGLMCVFTNATNPTVGCAQPPTTIGDAGWLEMVVPSQNGRVRWSDVSEAMAESIRLDKESVRSMFPDGEINLADDSVMLMLLGANLVLGQRGSIAMTSDADGNRSIKLRVKIPESDSATKLGALGTQRLANVTINIDEDWALRTANKPLAICLHGLKSNPEIFGALRNELRQAGYATATVSYDDRRSIVESANLISNKCETLFRNARVKPRLALIGHSMGGLVAREWTENPALPNQRITTLITVASPHLGSNWATMPPLINLLADGTLEGRDLVNLLLHLPSSPGVRDLEPGSKMLETMNGRPRQNNVRYTAIVGTHCPINAEESRELRSAIRQLDQAESFTRLIRPRILPLLNDCDELIEGKGDGVVAVSSGMIPGVADTVLVPLAHSEMIARLPAGKPNPVWQLILDRLGAVD
ncbi:PGAP1-like alpha/beta domain-containing protein [Rubripirellula reticaptiva]|uniref:PGAP1-like protein n=1 Tax=Rubripirellula reticaptiva TaxID=2528013 RepID=A0A5C6F9S9_9BACT|nr:alpha/beta hydrolase [Rubripirellula reticaptiva]TWU57194.1 PGAP1-like protein [Rubripirellula reticaptiva]